MVPHWLTFFTPSLYSSLMCKKGIMVHILVNCDVLLFVVCFVWTISAYWQIWYLQSLELQLHNLLMAWVVESIRESLVCLTSLATRSRVSLTLVLVLEMTDGLVLFWARMTGGGPCSVWLIDPTVPPPERESTGFKLWNPRRSHHFISNIFQTFGRILLDSLNNFKLLLGASGLELGDLSLLRDDGNCWRILILMRLMRITVGRLVGLREVFI